MKRLLIAVAAGATLIAGCGSSSKSSSAAPASGGAYGASSSASSTSASSPPVTVSLKRASFGHILAGASGRTLYLFLADRGGQSACTGACAGVWPPLTGAARAGAGIRPALLGSITRADGTRQVTYAGKPVYYFARDKDAGDAYGEGIKSFGAEWYALGATGKRVEKPGS